MKRRFFIAGAAAVLSAPKILLAGGDGTVAYTPGLIKEKLAAGETVFVDYSATWCGTCKRQERIISELRANNPAFDENISFVKVDWMTMVRMKYRPREKSRADQRLCYCAVRMSWGESLQALTVIK